MRNGTKVAVLEILLGYLILVATVGRAAYEERKIVELLPEWEVVIFKNHLPDFSQTCKSLLCLLEKYRVKVLHVVFSQSLLETGFFTSPIYKKNKNPFGMKVSKRGINIDPKSQEFIKCGCYDKVHACYRTYEDAVKDFKMWQDDRLKAYANKFGREPVTDEQYLHFLNNIVIDNKLYRYATDKRYTIKVRTILKKYGHTEMFKTLGKSSASEIEVLKYHQDSFLVDTFIRWPNGKNLIIMYPISTRTYRDSTEL